MSTEPINRNAMGVPVPRGRGRSGHDWRNWETCECGELGCRSSRANASFRAYLGLPAESAKPAEANVHTFTGSTDPIDLQADVANWKRRYEEVQELLRVGGNTWEVTIRDRDEQKARADKAENELRDAERRLAESDERNSNLFDLGNKHLDTIDRVKAAGAKLQEAVDRIRRVLADGQHDESCGTQYRINPEPCDCWLADLREAIDGGGK